MTDYYLLCL